MSFARNFALGAQVAGDILGTYYDAREKSQLRKLSQAKPEEIQNAYTTQDAEQLRALANAKDANGNPYYSLEANQDGSYGLKANFSYAGQDGQMVQPGGIATTFTPRSTAVEFLGNRYAPEDLNEDRIAALRTRAMADVISERDPVRGLQMRRAIKADEREDERFSWERQQQPLKQRELEQRVEQGGIELDNAKRAQAWEKGFGEHLAAYTGSPEQIAETVKYLNKHSNSLTLGTPDEKTGLAKVSVVTPDGNSVFLQLSRADQARLYAAGKMLGTHPVQALKEMSAVNKDVAEAVARDNQLTELWTRINNDVAAKGHRMGVDERELAIKAAEANSRNAYYRATGRDRMEFVNDKGETVVLDLSRVPVGQDGRYQIPPGLRPKTAKPEITQKDVVNLATELMGTVNPKTGKPFTLTEAMRVARAELTGELDPMTELLLNLGKNGDPFAKPQPAAAPQTGRGIVAPQRTYGPSIVPPRTGAEALQQQAPVAPMSELEILRLISGQR